MASNIANPSGSETPQISTEPHLRLPGEVCTGTSNAKQSPSAPPGERKVNNNSSSSKDSNNSSNRASSGELEVDKNSNSKNGNNKNGNNQNNGRGRGAGRGRGRGGGRQQPKQKPHEAYKQNQRTLEDLFTNKPFKKFFTITANSQEHLSEAHIFKANRQLRAAIGGKPKRVTELRNGSSWWRLPTQNKVNDFST
jgi:hypothetical protein